MPHCECYISFIITLTLSLLLDVCKSDVSLVAWHNNYIYSYVCLYTCLFAHVCLLVYMSLCLYICYCIFKAGDYVSHLWLYTEEPVSTLLRSLTLIWQQIGFSTTYFGKSITSNSISKTRQHSSCMVVASLISATRPFN